jgi:hypothetical protein
MIMLVIPFNSIRLLSQANRKVNDYRTALDAEVEMVSILPDAKTMLSKSFKHFCNRVKAVLP